MLVHIEQKMATTLSLTVYTSRLGAMTDTGKFNGVNVAPGVQMPVYIGHLADDK